jgi:hypothetical protein
MRDGNGNVLPRDLINFCIEAQKLQNSFDIQGIEKPTGGNLISARAIREAFPQTAASKLSDFLQVFRTNRVGLNAPIVVILSEAKNL